jgi:hypothetical protein
MCGGWVLMSGIPTDNADAVLCCCCYEVGWRGDWPHATTTVRTVCPWQGLHHSSLSSSLQCGNVVCVEVRKNFKTASKNATSNA